MQVQIFSGYHPDHKKLYEDIFNLTKEDVGWVYPNYDKWYHETFLPDLKRGNRSYVVASRNLILAGCCLLKKTPEEQKICTFYVGRNYRRQGIGSDLMTAALQELDGGPIITVSPGLLPTFAPFLSHFCFQAIFQKNNNADYGCDICFKQSIPAVIQRVSYPWRNPRYEVVKIKE